MKYLEALAYKKYALGRRESKNITNTLKEARPMLAISPKDLDSNCYLLCTPDGTYDLRLGMSGRRDHRSEDFMTKVTAVSPGEAGSDLWAEQLNLLFCGDQELIDYVQLVAGTACIGRVFIEEMIIAYGSGANGKSTFWNVLARVLGTYSGNLSADALTVGNRRNIKPEMAELKGKRLVIAGSGGGAGGAVHLYRRKYAPARPALLRLTLSSVPASRGKQVINLDQFNTPLLTYAQKRGYTSINLARLNLHGPRTPWTNGKHGGGAVGFAEHKEERMKDKYAALRLENQLCFPLYACAKEIVKAYKPFLDELGLTYTQYITMMVLWEHKELRVKEVGEKLFLDSSTLTPLLKRLEEKGYVTRRRSDQDERDVFVAITEAGEALKERALTVPQRLAACVQLEPEKAAGLYTTLYEIIGKLTDRE